MSGHVAVVECDGETWIRGKLNAAGRKLKNGTKLYPEVALTAAKERIRELEVECAESEEIVRKFEVQMLAEREVLLAEQALSDKLEKALKLADIQYMGCGGNLRPEEVVSAMQRVIQAALAEVAHIRSQEVVAT